MSRAERDRLEYEKLWLAREADAFALLRGHILRSRSVNGMTRHTADMTERKHP
jgi:hypothetical protein